MRVVTQETRQKLSLKLRGRVFTPEWKQKMSEAMKGRVPWNKGKKTETPTLLKLAKAKKKNWQDPNYAKGMSEAHKGQQVGKENYQWKGGITPLTSLVRSLPEMKQWIREVFERDNYTCQECSKRGIELNAHHRVKFSILFRRFLKEFSQFSLIEDRETLLRLALSYKPFWKLSNGKTLCVDCHNKTKGKI